MSRGTGENLEGIHVHLGSKEGLLKAVSRYARRENVRASLHEALLNTLQMTAFPRNCLMKLERLLMEEATRVLGLPPQGAV